MESVGLERSELRAQIARIIERRRDPVISDTVSVFPFAESQPLEGDDRARLCELVLRALIGAVVDRQLDPRSNLVTDLRAFTEDHNVSVQQMYAVTYLLERTALDELALDETLGATSEQWPAIAQLVRHASFDCLAAFTDRLARDAGRGLIDPLTTVYTRAVLDAVLEKEIHRAERRGHPFALILLDVDRLSDLNAAHGYGFGDRVLERIGIVMRSFFRELDWVARHSEDAFAVILPETASENAELLAEQLRVMVAERLALRDYRSEERVQVTVSVAVVIGEALNADVRPDQVLQQAEEAVVRAKQAGRNRIERLDISPTRERPAMEGSRKPQIS